MSAPPMDVLEAIRGRRSVRSYRKRAVDRATIRALLDSAVRAPTAMHAEPWRFLVIQHPGILRRLARDAKDALVDEVKRLPEEQRHGIERFESDDYDALYGAGTLVVIGARRVPFAEADCWLAAENLMLAAHAMGLGTCVIGCAVHALNSPAWKEELGLEPDVVAVAPLVLGYPDAETPATTRKPPEILWK